MIKNILFIFGFWDFVYSIIILFYGPAVRFHCRFLVDIFGDREMLILLLLLGGHTKEKELECLFCYFFSSCLLRGKQEQNEISFSRLET